jgi:iron-sulfur cluster repair protein YtfE (RIC family)
MSALGSPDVTDLILEEHAVLRSQFVALWDLRASGEGEDVAGLWQPLADLLEVHAKAEEDIVYPILLKRGSHEAPEETDDAIRDHNDIRDAIRAAGGATSASDSWWDAVMACRKANDEHLAEEERDVIPDLREHSGEGLRSDLGVRWTAFHAEHRGARGVPNDDVEPQEYIEEHS